MVVGDGGREAYTAIVWGGLLSRESQKNRRGRAGRNRRRQHVQSRYARGCRSAVVKDPITHERNASEPGRPRLARSRAQRSRAAAGRRGAEAAVEQARGRTSLVVPMKRPNKPARSGGGGRGGKGARSEGWQTTGDAPGAVPDSASDPRRLPADRRCGHVRVLADHARPPAGARCGQAARRDLCGGQGVIPVPTATSVRFYTDGPSAPSWRYHRDHQAG